MRRVLRTLAAAALLLPMVVASTPVRVDAAEGAVWPAVFDPAILRTLNIQISTQDWDFIRKDLTETYRPGWLSASDEAPILVAVRRKSSRALPAYLGSAIETFERLGAGLWRAQAEAELGRISGRAPSAGGLTPTEERVAALVAEGLTNQEVAAGLFITLRTVETNLTRIYQKLGVRSRTELSRRLAGAQVSASEATPAGVA